MFVLVYVCFYLCVYIFVFELVYEPPGTGQRTTARVREACFIRSGLHTQAVDIWTFGHLDNSEHGEQMLDQPLCPIICPWLNATSASRICTLPQINFSRLAGYGRIVGPNCMVVPWLGNTYIS